MTGITTRIRTALQTPWRVAAAVLSSLVVLASLLAGSYAWAFDALDDSTTIDTGDIGERPERLDTGALNLLIMGVDDRTGSKFNDPGAGASDTTMLVHLYAGRQKALVISIPRDTMVDVPECTDRRGRTLAPRFEQFNWAFSQGGPLCTVRTVEAITGVYLDHFVTVNLAGFTAIVDALGGVEMCLEKPISSTKAHVDLPAGRQVLDGDQALGYVRARYVGDGSDLSRIERQQQFLRAMADKVTTVGVLANPLRLRNVLDATADAIATDPDLASSDAKRDLATSLRSLRTKDITFVTAPVVEWSQNRNRVVFVEADARELWQAVREDGAWPPKGTPGFDGRPLVTPPEKVRVKVLNGTSTVGLARTVADELAALGFEIVGVGNADRKDYLTSEVRHDPAYDESARTLATAAGTPGLVVDEALGRTVVLVVGQDWSGATAVRVTAQPSPSPTTSGSGGTSTATSGSPRPSATSTGPCG